MSLILNGTDGLSDVDGTAATPAIRGTDTNTGIFFPAADTIAFSEGGVEAMRLDASGNVLVGTTTSTALSTGQLQIGTTSAADSAIQILTSTTGTSGIYFGDGTTGDTRYRGAVEYANNGDSLRFYSTSTERMRIDSSGNLLVGTTTFASASDSSNPTGTAGVGISSQTSGGVLNLKLSGTNGTIVNFARGGIGIVGSISITTSATAYNTSSDYRLKENIAPMTGALDTISQLKPCTYTWKVDGSNGQGFIAHELQVVVPDCVTGEKDAVNEDGTIKPQGIDTSFLVATLTAAIQEQQALITQLQADVAALKVQP